MDALPKDIADMCGVVMTAPEKKEAPASEPVPSPVQWVREGDGTFVLTYFGKIAGWTNVTKQDKREGKTYRAVTVHGDVRLCFSEKEARDWLLSRYH
jgi:hypothetical protein